jgi:hypothetical protein
MSLELVEAAVLPWAAVSVEEPTLFALVWLVTGVD